MENTYGHFDSDGKLIQTFTVDSIESDGLVVLGLDEECETWVVIVLAHGQSVAYMGDDEGSE
jgi:hypothetical protein